MPLYIIISLVKPFAWYPKSDNLTLKKNFEQNKISQIVSRGLDDFLLGSRALAKFDLNHFNLDFGQKYFFF
jgi:hypothetical protein